MSVGLVALAVMVAVILFWPDMDREHDRLDALLERQWRRSQRP